MQTTLREKAFEAQHIALTGANGYLGALAAASLLRGSAARIVCLVRSSHAAAAVRARIADEWQQLSGGRWSAAVERRIDVIHLPADTADVDTLHAVLAGCDEFVHAAGTLDVRDPRELDAANLWFTAHLLRLARRLAVRRFVYLSSAFAGGLCPGALAEAPLAEPAADPSPGTRSKRHAERLVAASGLPFVVIRPGVLIGCSRHGRYSGSRPWPAFLPATGGAPAYLVHQDAFCLAFQAAHRWLPAGAYMNLVSTPAARPALREVRAPGRRGHAAAAAAAGAGAANLPPAVHRWDFDSGWLDALRTRGLAFADARPASVRRCQAAAFALPLEDARAPHRATAIASLQGAEVHCRAATGGVVDRSDDGRQIGSQAQRPGLPGGVSSPKRGAAGRALVLQAR